MTETEQFFLSLVKDGILSIDDQGRVWQQFARRGNQNRPHRWVRIQRKRAERYRNDYLALGMRVDGCLYEMYAHRLVWIFFHGDIADELQVNHKDGVKSHNHPVNLELVTSSENILHAFRTGLKHAPASNAGATNPNAKLTEEDVRTIREEFATGRYSRRALARRHSVTPPTINRIVDGTGWTSVD